MLNTKKLIESIDSFIASTDHKLSSDELQQIYNIRVALNSESRIDEVQKWLVELFKLMMLAKEFFDK